MVQSVLIWLTKKASEDLKNLLENKHLYQHLTCDPIDLIKRLLEQEKEPLANARLRDELIHVLPSQRFVLCEAQATLVGRQSSQLPLSIVVGNVSLFCKVCERREAFAPAWFCDATDEILLLRGGSRPISIPAKLQLFFLTYQCQRCLKNLESFIVQRLGWALSLHGRSPMEHIEVPPFIPKPEYHLYRDAVIANNSGKSLAALFYLRTFIEQFVRRLTGLTGRVTGDEILDAYYDLLPLAQKDSMPSLRLCYDKLSEALHSAHADSVLFEESMTAVNKHLAIRKVFEMPEALKDPQRIK